VLPITPQRLSTGTKKTHGREADRIAGIRFKIEAGSTECTDIAEITKS
jgi:hypothetical protein